MATWDTFLKIIKNNNYISRRGQYQFISHKKIMIEKQRIVS